MGRVELLEFVALGAEVHQVLAVLVEFEDVVAGVAVGEIDVAAGKDGDGCRCELGELEARLFGKFESQGDVTTVGIELDAFGAVVASAVDELNTALVTN